MTRAAARLVPAALVLIAAGASRYAWAQALEPPPSLGPAPGGSTPASLPNTPIMPSSSSADESEDSGLGLEWVWLNADAGGAFINMTSFSATNLGPINTQSGGPAFGLGAGVRLLFLTLGARVRDLLLSSIGSLWTLNLEAAFHTRIWHIDPYFGVRGGYNFVGSLNSSAAQVATGGSPSDISVHGWNIGPTVGIDVYFTKLVSIGADVDFMFLFLQRPQPPLPAGVTLDMLPPNLQTLYANSGSSVGLGVTPTAHLGIHF